MDRWLFGYGQILLGRLIQRDLFRESNEEVSTLFSQYLGARTSKRGAALMLCNGQTWEVASLLLQHYFEIKFRKNKLCRNPREVAAIEAFLTDPTRTAAKLANLAKTTEKQLNRMTTLTLARKLPLYDRLHS